MTMRLLHVIAVSFGVILILLGVAGPGRTSTTPVLHAYAYSQDGKTAVVCATSKRDARSVLGKGAVVGKRLGHQADVAYCGAPAKPKKHTSAKAAAAFVSKCLITPSHDCQGSRWDDDMKIVLDATWALGPVVKWCPPQGRYGSWRDGFCLGLQDDSGPYTIIDSNNGILQRAGLVH